MPVGLRDCESPWDCGNANTCRIAGARSTEESVAYTVCGTMYRMSAYDMKKKRNVLIQILVTGTVKETLRVKQKSEDLDCYAVALFGDGDAFYVEVKGRMQLTDSSKFKIYRFSDINKSVSSF